MNAFKDPCWGLAAGEVWRPTDFHALGCAFLASRTLESALLRLERYYRIVVQDVALRVTTDRDSGTMTITYAPPSEDADIPTLQDTCWSVILRMCRDAYGPDLPLHEVQLTHPWQACAYEQFFGCPVRYESDRSGLTFPIDAMRRPLRAVNRELARASDRILSDFDRCLADTSITGRVRRAVLDALPSGKPSATDVARGLALAPRTLQRKLQEEGTTFQEVSDAVRKELAQQYVQSGEYDLGDSDLPHRVRHPVGLLPRLQDLDRAHPLRRPRSRLTPHPPLRPAACPPLSHAKNCPTASVGNWRNMAIYWRFTTTLLRLTPDRVSTRTQRLHRQQGQAPRPAP